MRLRVVSRLEGSVTGLLVVSAAFAAALVAHVTIDALGDVALARDAYDNVGHDSRALALCAAMLAMCLLAWRVIDGACSQAAGRGSPLRAALARADRSSVGWFVASTAGLTFAVLAAMGGLDSVLDGVPIRDVADVFGGSLSLSFGVTLCIALAAAFAARALLRSIVASHETLVGALVALLARAVRSRSFVAVCIDDDVPANCRQRETLGKRAGKRGPPHPFS